MSNNLIFQPLVDQVITGAFSSLLTAERQEDLAEIGKAWDFYYGKQEIYIKQYRGETNEDYQDKDKTVFNYTKLIVDEYINGVFARPVAINLKDKKQQEVWDKIADPMTFFKILPFLTKCQRIAEISDTCLVMIRYDKVEQKTYFEDIRGEFVVFLPDKNNPKEIGTVIISYLFDTGESELQKRFLKRIEIWNKERWAVWLYSPSLQDKKLIGSGKNPYGFIPAARFQPEEDDNTFYGITSVPDVVKVNEVYNNLWAALVRICIMQSFSVLVVKSEGDLDITVAPTRFLKFEQTENAEADYITPSPKINDVKQVLESLKKELQNFSQVPSSVISSSDESAIPQSGYALKIKRIPIEQAWQKRRMSYGPSLKNLIRLAILVDNVNRNETVDLDIQVDVEFSSTTPENSPQEQIVKDESDLRHNIITPVDIMLRKYPTMTRDEAIKKIQDNKEESQKLGVGEFEEEPGEEE